MLFQMGMKQKENRFCRADAQVAGHRAYALAFEVLDPMTSSEYLPGSAVAGRAELVLSKRQERAGSMGSPSSVVPVGEALYRARFL